MSIGTVSDKNIMPLHGGNELSVDSFKVGQNDNTYRLAAPRYQSFYSSYIRPRIAMYRGWVQGFHNTEYGVLPTLFLQKIGAGIVSTIFGKPLVLNTEDQNTGSVIQKQYKKSVFGQTLKEAYGFALDGGTGLIKWNKDGNNQLRAEALPMDKFFTTVDAYGDMERVRSFISTYHDTVSSSYEYHLCEERFFRYATIAGEQKRFPMVHYLVYRTSSNATHEHAPNANNAIRWGDIPYNVRKMLQRDYGDILIDYGEYGDIKDYDRCTLLPFEDDLGCRLIKFTQNIPAFPKLPFGQPIADLLMNESYAYDQLKFFERLEVYIARGRIMVDKKYSNPNDPDSRKGILDPFVFTYYDTMLGDGDSKEPKGMQLALRADDIARQKQNILNDAAFSLNLSSTTIAAWLSDGQTQKTATEIEFERTKTTAFINDHIEIIQEPVQEMIDLFFHYYGASAPEVHIMPENQTVKTERINLFSALYDKKQITSTMLAQEILDTCSTKEVKELADYIEQQRAAAEQQAQAQMQQQLIPIKGDNAV